MVVIVSFQNARQGNFPSCIWVRSNYVTSLGIYLVLPVASGWFVAIAVVLITAFWLGLF